MAKKGSRRPNFKCARCGDWFWRKPSSINDSKSGLTFCTRRCKDLSQRIEGGLEGIRPAHYGDVATGDYKRVAFRDMPHECGDCGYDEHPEILVVHHLNGKRSDNRLENLTIVCPNCHALRHYKRNPR
jgi:5-methylcytosine-specific restriction endonuclease McrA